MMIGFLYRHDLLGLFGYGTELQCRTYKELLKQALTIRWMPHRRLHRMLLVTSAHHRGNLAFILCDLGGRHVSTVLSANFGESAWNADFGCAH